MEAPSQVVLAFFEICAVFLGSSVYLSTVVSRTQSEPYMDEIFHVRQAQTYCAGNFSQWDPKITTLPGLYIVSVGVLKPLMEHLHDDALCGTFWLRLTNAGFALANFYILFELVKKIHHRDKDYGEGRALLTALNLSLFPILYFFTYLYYTDPGSTFVVLLTYLLHLHGNTALAGLTGALSILFRQTNIVWVIFVAGLQVADIMQKTVGKSKAKDQVAEKYDAIDEFNDAFTRLFAKLRTQHGRGIIFSIISSVLARTWPYICVGLGFAGFIILNEGIVVGDRTAHEACLHFPQIFYYVSLTFGFSLPVLFQISTVVNFFKHISQRWLIYLLFVILSCVLVWKFTYAHPYLLADNRHYPFYVWSKIYRKHDLIKFALIPGYIFAMYCVYSKLNNKDIWWRMVYIICLLVATVPQKLLEFRYFILPYLIWRMNIPISSYPRLAVELLFYVLVNVVTLYLFLYKPFEWENEPGVSQRFIW